MNDYVSFKCVQTLRSCLENKSFMSGKNNWEPACLENLRIPDCNLNLHCWAFFQPLCASGCNQSILTDFCCIDEPGIDGVNQEELEGSLLRFLGADDSGAIHEELASPVVGTDADGVIHEELETTLCLLLGTAGGSGVIQPAVLFNASLPSWAAGCGSALALNHASTIAIPKSFGYEPDSRRTSFLPVHLFLPVLSTWTSEVRMWFSFALQGQSLTIAVTHLCPGPAAAKRNSFQIFVPLPCSKAHRIVSAYVNFSLSSVWHIGCQNQT